MTFKKKHREITSSGTSYSSRSFAAMLTNQDCWSLRNGPDGWQRHLRLKWLSTRAFRYQRCEKLYDGAVRGECESPKSENWSNVVETLRKKVTRVTFECKTLFFFFSKCVTVHVWMFRSVDSAPKWRSEEENLKNISSNYMWMVTKAILIFVFSSLK